MTEKDENIIDDNTIYNMETDEVELDMSQREVNKVGQDTYKSVEDNVEYLNQEIKEGNITMTDNGELYDTGNYEQYSTQKGKTTIRFTPTSIKIYMSTNVMQGIVWGGIAGACYFVTSGVGSAACVIVAGYIAGWTSTYISENFGDGMKATYSKRTHRVSFKEQ